MPSVPPAQTVPQARDLSYPLVIMGLRARRLRHVTDAAITPTQAASMVPIKIVAMASPPRNLPSQT